MESFFLFLILILCITSTIPLTATVRIHVSDETINITTPQYPNNFYPNNLQLHWNVTVSPGYHLRMIIHSFSVQPVCCDQLRLYEYNRLICTFRANIANTSPFIFSSHQLLLTFHRDAQGQFPGFSISFCRTSLAPVYPIAPCGFQRMATSEQQHLSSPFAPYNYPNSATCTWTLTARRYYCISLTVELFRTELYGVLFIESPAGLLYTFGGSNYSPYPTSLLFPGLSTLFF